ncbi:hypothetical protein GF108_06845 [Phyllobacterium sp. SYP-B3895]|uniref:hypothetical protein n=1 Tax=Phyllobacterium sp. SYP-B3895 TaxID=2663240 RepID=UPI001299D063|nr:hypothetical protein [Phyllobacterium sp. SYP-B3895]MRG55300.1 hypothetical protein [Phyllobacterium sp. SYP-B3895]
MAAAVDAAENLLGKNEKIDSGKINAFLKAGGVDLNAAATAWCAGFVNSSLAQMGVRGSGSNVATSFSNWGIRVNPQEVARGDVLVQSRGRAVGQTGGHVGFATGQVRFRGGRQELEMLSGNSADEVRKSWVNAGQVLIRRATEGISVPADQLKSASQAFAPPQGGDRTVKAREEKKAFDELYATNQKRLDQQREENQINADWTLTADQKALAIAKQAEAQKLYDPAKEQGLTIDDRLRSQIDAQATAMARAGLAADKLKDSTGDLATKQKKAADAYAELNQAFAEGIKSGITGFINDMRNGVSAGEAFANMLKRPDLPFTPDTVTSRFAVFSYHCVRLAATGRIFSRLGTTQGRGIGCHRLAERNLQAQCR